MMLLSSGVLKAGFLGGAAGADKGMKEAREGTADLSANLIPLLLITSHCTCGRALNVSEAF
ncbi:MAG: hypothetical protein AB8H12_06120 [Lewinella sp.]